MKKVLLITLLLINFAAISQGTFKITGQVRHPTERKVLITLYRNWVDDEETYEVALDATNKFKLELPLINIAYLDFYYSDEGFHNWVIEPSDEIDVTFDTKHFWDTFYVTGKGNQKWLYYVQAQKIFETNHDWHLQADTLWKKLPIKNYFDKLDNEQTKQINFLVVQKSLVSPEFFELRKADIVGSIQTLKLDRLATNKSSKLDTSEVKKYLKIDALTPEARAASFEYGNMQSNWIELLTAKIMAEKNRELSPVEEYNLVKTHYINNQIDRNLTERLLAAKIKTLIEGSGMTTENQDLLLDYLNFTMNQSYKDYFIQKTAFAQSLGKGAPAASFTLSDNNGKPVILADFLGKVVYLRFWASWSKPSLEDQKVLDEVKNHFKDNPDVVIINISVDEINEWQKSIQELDLQGINIRTDDNGPILKSYGVTDIPSYFLINRKGNFAVSPAANPSDEEGKTLIGQIEATLKEN